jgi:DNA modification methylase
MKLNTIGNIDCIEGLRLLPDESVDCCITSPPYYELRDYGVEGQIGLEESPEAFVQKMVDVFTEVKRVLKKEGTLWLNLGDSYWGGKGMSGTQSPEEADKRNHFGKAITKKYQQMGGPGQVRVTDKKHESIKAKDLIGIPWMVAFALRSSGWYLRQDIIWHKPNPMPESVTDRCTKHMNTFSF